MYGYSERLDSSDTCELQLTYMVWGLHREARYVVEDKWPNNSASPRPMISHEDEVLGAALEDLSRSGETKFMEMMITN